MGVRGWRGVRGWVAPVLTALVVVALVLGVNALAGPGSGGGGPGPGRPTAGVAISATGEPVDLPRDVARILGYRARGTALVLTYRIRYDDCRSVEVQVAAAEALDTVAVRLLAVPGGEQSLTACPDGPVERRVRVPLSKPLLYRTVLDASADNASVPRLD